jgi:hypothetical protein
MIFSAPQNQTLGHVHNSFPRAIHELQALVVTIKNPNKNVPQFSDSCEFTRKEYPDNLRQVEDFLLAHFSDTITSLGVARLQRGLASPAAPDDGSGSPNPVPK